MLNPAAHEPQSSDALCLVSHWLHVAFFQLLRHVHVHPVKELPETFAAFPLQFELIVHVK